MRDCPERCPVRLYELYKALCPSNRPDDAFYLRPLDKPTDKQWFSIAPVGVNTLSNVVKRLCSTAGFVGYFTNHSLRTTAATRLFDAEVDEQLIKIKTGHSSDAVRSYKRVSDDKLESLSDIVACKPATKIVKVDTEANAGVSDKGDFGDCGPSRVMQFSSCVFKDCVINLNGN